MNVVRCKNGHFFNKDKYDSCPSCQQPDQDKEKDPVTVAKDAVQWDMKLSDQLTDMYFKKECLDDKTISPSFAKRQFSPTAGWLVCVKGKQYGRTLPIYFGRNFAGRSMFSDIHLGNEQWISRDNHFSIVYDPKSIRFMLLKGTGAVELNGIGVLSPQELKENDRISLGEESEYVFIPYCKQGRCWDEKND